MRRTLLLPAALLLAACGDRTEPGETAAAPAVDSAIATMPGDPTDNAAVALATGANAAVRDANGRELGTLTIADSPQGIVVTGTLRGLPPGTLALHFHTVGQCEPPFESAGGHWNPTGRQHGTENPQGPHFGDMPNLTVGADSTAQIQAATPGGALSGENALLDADGAAIMLHAGPDDYRTDPAGNAGARIACGVVMRQ